MSGQPTPTDWTDSNDLGGITKPARSWLDQTTADLVAIDGEIATHETRLDALDEKRVGRNLLVNGGFDVWQAATGDTGSVAGGASRVRSADCWWAVRAGGATGYTMAHIAGGAADGANRFVYRSKRDAGNAATENMIFGQTIETVDTVYYRKNSAVLSLSFSARAGNNYSGGTFTAEVVGGTSTNQNVLDGFTGETVLGTISATLTASHQVFSGTATVTSTMTELGVRFTWTPTGTAGADDSVYVQNVQLELADAPTAFEVLPFAATLAQCQRYYQKTFPYGTAPAQSAGNFGYVHAVSAAGAIAVNVALPLTVEMRVPAGSGATATFYNPSAGNAQGRNTGAGVDTTGLTAYSGASAKMFMFSFTQAVGSTVGQLHNFNWQIADDTY